MNEKALLVHMLLEPGTVEKQCDGRGKALCKCWERKVLQLSLLLLPGFCSGQQCVVNGAWSCIVAVIINKAHIFFFANIFFICITFTDDRAIILWQCVVFINTHNQVQKKAWGLESLNPIPQSSVSDLCLQWDDLLEEAVVYWGWGVGLGGHVGIHRWDISYIDFSCLSLELLQTAL